mmetsp:Transcript_51084/g.121366  ORF Transcript_51084/g.121366 Transcript_51084/m.121366 type:complete len:358 (-) Transcript_51084:30-1103(-)
MESSESKEKFPQEHRCLYPQTGLGPVLSTVRLSVLVVVCHYLLYPLILAGAVAVAWRREFLPRRWLGLSVVAYIGQLVFYRPHTSGGWRNEWFRGSRIWDLCQSWLDPVWIVEAPLDPKKKYIFAVAPHGIIGVCRLLFEGTVWKRLFPSMTLRPRWCGATPQFLVPGCREFMLAFAMDASKPYLQKELRSGRSLLLLPGGTAELLLTDTSQDTKLVITDRKGFVKLAIQEDAEIVPIMVFGEKWCYNQFLLPGPLRKLLYSLFYLPGTLFMGCWGTLVPGYVRKDQFGNGQPIKLGVVIGKPISKPAGKDVDVAVDEMHATFMDSMTGIFNGYKDRFGYEASQSMTMVASKKGKAD